MNNSGSGARGTGSDRGREVGVQATRHRDGRSQRQDPTPHPRESRGGGSAGGAVRSVTAGEAGALRGMGPRRGAGRGFRERPSGWWRAEVVAAGGDGGCGAAHSAPPPPPSPCACKTRTRTIRPEMGHGGVHRRPAPTGVRGVGAQPQPAAGPRRSGTGWRRRGGRWAAVPDSEQLHALADAHRSVPLQWGEALTDGSGAVQEGGRDSERARPTGPALYTHLPGGSPTATPTNNSQVMG